MTPTRSACQIALRLVLSCAAAACANEASSGDIVVKASTTVRSGVIYLADVASIIGDDPLHAESLARVVIGPAPQRSTIVTADVVRDRIRASGLDNSDLMVIGQSRCRVLVSAAPEARSARPLHVTRSEQSAVEARLAAEVSRRLEIAFPNNGPFRVEVEAPAQTVQLVSAIVGELPIRGGSSDLDEPQQLEVVSEIPAAFTANITQIERVAVAAVPLNRGAVITANHVRFEPRDEPGVTDPTLVIGQQLKRNIPEGRTLQPTDVQKLQLIRANSLVTVSISLPGMRVSRHMKSRSAGGLGDSITCVSLDGRTTLLAQVTGPGEASLPSPSAQQIANPGISDSTGQVVFEDVQRADQSRVIAIPGQQQQQPAGGATR